MRLLNKIIYEFENSKEVKRYKELISYINKNTNIKNKYKELLKIQKELVNLNYYKKDSNNKKEEYINKYNELLNEPFFEELLELRDNINETLKMIKEIIEGELEI